MAEKKLNKYSGLKGDLAILEDIANMMEAKNLSFVKYASKDKNIEIERGGQRQTAINYMAPVPTQPMPTVAQPISQQNIGDTAKPVVDDVVDLSNAVKSPVVGTVYLASKPGEPNFVKVGDKVKVGAVLMIVEAMKVMNQITAPKTGVVQKILVENEEPVEFGQPLILLV